MTPNETPAAPTLSSRSFTAALWSMVGRGGSETLKLVSSLILTRLLFPEAFGLMATALTVMQMVQLFTDTGTRISIIQNPRGAEPAFLNTAWMIGILRGAGLCLLLAALSWPMALFFHKPGLAPILLLLSLTPLVAGFENPALALVIRALNARRQILYDLLPQFGGFVVTATLAWWLRSVWALALGAFLVSLLKLAASYWINPYRPRFSWEEESGRALIQFGKFVLLNTMITWSATNLDRFFLGRMLGMDVLGIYSVGLNLGVAIELFFNQMLGNSYFPALSSVTHDKPRSVRVFKRSLVALIALGTPLLATLALFGDEVIAILYDKRYTTAGLVLFWISLRGFPRLLSVIFGSTLFAFGVPRYETAAMGVALAALVTLLPLGTSLYGMTGALGALWLVGFSGTFAEAYFLVRRLGFPVSAIGVPVLQAAAVAAAAFGAHHLLSPWLHAPAWRAVPFMVTIFALSAAVSFLAWRLAQRSIPPFPTRAPDEGTPAGG